MVLNIIEVIFWAVVMGLTFQANARICIGASCAVTWVVAVLCLVLLYASPAKDTGILLTDDLGITGFLVSRPQWFLRLTGGTSGGTTTAVDPRRPLSATTRTGTACTTIRRCGRTKVGGDWKWAGTEIETERKIGAVYNSIHPVGRYDRALTSSSELIHNCENLREMTH